MLYWLAQTLDFAGVFNLVRYLSFRAGASIATALLIGLVIGPRFIGWLRVRQGKGQPIRDDGPQSHLAKRGTPTMGGLMIRSEEHTSELQSLMRISYAVFCLKKKKHNNTNTKTEYTLNNN